MAVLHLKRFSFRQDPQEIGSGAPMMRKIQSAVDITPVLTVTSTNDEGGESKSKYFFTAAIEHLSKDDSRHYQCLTMRTDGAHFWFVSYNDAAPPQLVSAKFRNPEDPSSWQLEWPKTMATNAYLLFYTAFTDEPEAKNFAIASGNHDGAARNVRKSIGRAMAPLSQEQRVSLDHPRARHEPTVVAPETSTTTTDGKYNSLEKAHPTSSPDSGFDYVGEATPSAPTSPPTSPGDVALTATPETSADNTEMPVPEDDSYEEGELSTKNTSRSASPIAATKTTTQTSNTTTPAPGNTLDSKTAPGMSPAKGGFEGEGAAGKPSMSGEVTLDKGDGQEASNSSSNKNNTKKGATEANVDSESEPVVVPVGYVTHEWITDKGFIKVHDENRFSTRAYVERMRPDGPLASAPSLDGNDSFKNALRRDFGEVLKGDREYFMELHFVKGMNRWDFYQNWFNLDEDGGISSIKPDCAGFLIPLAFPQLKWNGKTYSCRIWVPVNQEISPGGSRLEFEVKTASIPAHVLEWRLTDWGFSLVRLVKAAEGFKDKWFNLLQEFFESFLESQVFNAVRRAPCPQYNWFQFRTVHNAWFIMTPKQARLFVANGTAADPEVARSQILPDHITLSDVRFDFVQEFGMGCRTRSGLDTSSAMPANSLELTETQEVQAVDDRSVECAEAASESDRTAFAKEFENPSTIFAFPVALVQKANTHTCLDHALALFVSCMSKDISEKDACTVLSTLRELSVLDLQEEAGTNYIRCFNYLVTCFGISAAVVKTWGKGWKGQYCLFEQNLHHQVPLLVFLQGGTHALIVYKDYVLDPMSIGWRKLTRGVLIEALPGKQPYTGVVKAWALERYTSVPTPKAQTLEEWKPVAKTKNKQGTLLAILTVAAFMSDVDVPALYSKLNNVIDSDTVKLKEYEYRCLQTFAKHMNWSSMEHVPLRSDKQTGEFRQALKKGEKGKNVPIFVKFAVLPFIIVFYDQKVYSPSLGQPLPVNERNLDILFRSLSFYFRSNSKICEFKDVRIERQFVPRTTASQQTKTKKKKKKKKKNQK